MREFESRGSRLGRLSPSAKWLYASFNVLTVAGFLTSLALYWDSMGIRLGQTAAYYVGDDDGTLVPDADTIYIPKEPRYLLEITHQHLFAMPVVMLVLGHLFLLARGGKWKNVVVVAAPLLTIAHLLGPWIVRYGGPAYAWWMPLTGIPYVAVYLVMAIWPLPELFRTPPSDPVQ